MPTNFFAFTFLFALYSFLGGFLFAAGKEAFWNVLNWAKGKRE